MRHAHRKRLAAVAAAFLAVSGTAAAAASSTGSEGLAKRIRPGDIVAVTDCSGSRVTGRVVTVSDASLVLSSGPDHVPIAAAAITRVKLVRRHDSRASARRADVGSRCGDPGCMVLALTLGSVSAVRQGLAQLFGGGRTVYRARPPASCGGARAWPERLQPSVPALTSSAAVGPGATPV